MPGRPAHSSLKLAIRTPHDLGAPLQEGLEGNRVVQAGDVWGVVAATARAYPLQLGPSVERAQAALGATPTRPLAELWVLQAAADGALAPLVAALRKQPQILTAYTKAAPLRDPALSAQLETLVSQLQVGQDRCRWR